jgi:DNA invertase Pin-like site-specific DNA recombinase
MANANRTKAAQAEQVLIPAVAYVRCSDEHQINASIPAQEASIEKWAAENGYRILRWYKDEGISGWKEDREQFQRLIADLEKRRDFHAVLCWHTNRFSRFPVLEANHYWFLLDRAGVHLATVAQGRQDWADIGSWLKASIEQHGDAQHRVKLSADVKRGMRRIAEQGIWSGTAPLGYRIGENRKLVLGDPADVALIVRIFEEYIRSASLRGLAHALNGEGIPTSTGGTWGPGSLQRILTNVAYVGTFQRAGVEILNCHPAIIEVPTFDRAQVLLGQRQKITTPHENGGCFILSGLCRCGKCEGAMTGIDSAVPRYQCSTAHRKGSTACDLNLVRQDVLLEAMLAGIEQQVNTPRFVARLRERIEAFVRRDVPKVDRAKVERELATVESKLAKAKARLIEVDRDMIPLVQDSIRALLSEQARLHDAVKAVQTPAERILVEHDQRIEAMVKAFSELRQSFREADPAVVREALRQRVARVDVWATRDGIGRKYPYRFDHGVAHVIGSDAVTCCARRAAW